MWKMINQSICVNFSGVISAEVIVTSDWLTGGVALATASEYACPRGITTPTSCAYFS